MSPPTCHKTEGFVAFSCQSCLYWEWQGSKTNTPTAIEQGHTSAGRETTVYYKMFALTIIELGKEGGGKGRI